MTDEQYAAATQEQRNQYDSWLRDDGCVAAERFNEYRLEGIDIGPGEQDYEV